MADGDAFIELSFGFGCEDESYGGGGFRGDRFARPFWFCASAVGSNS